MSQRADRRLNRTVAVPHDPYRCLKCQREFRARRPQFVQWVPDPGPDPVTGKWDPERGRNIGDSPPSCPHCSSKYIRRLA